MDKMKSILIEMQRPMATMAASLSEINDGLKSKLSMAVAFANHDASMMHLV